MKKSLLLIPLIIISCKKEANISETPNRDSAVVTEMHDAARADSAELRKKDSIVNNAPVTKEVLRKGVMRNEKEGQIVRTADASQLPFTLGEEFTKEGQELV